MSVAEKLNHAKDQKGMTISQISKLSQIPVTTVSRILSGETASPSLEAISAIAVALDISIDELVGIKIDRKCTIDELEDFVDTKYAEELKFLKDQLKHNQLEKKKIFGLVMFLVAILVFFLLADIVFRNQGWIRS